MIYILEFYSKNQKEWLFTALYPIRDKMVSAYMIEKIREIQACGMPFRITLTTKKELKENDEK
jgi:hypothetical protein